MITCQRDKFYLHVTKNKLKRRFDSISIVPNSKNETQPPDFDKFSLKISDYNNV